MKMYDMYPYPEAITLRASEAELRRWQADGVEEIDPNDYENARQVVVVERVAADDALRRERLGAQLGHNTMQSSQTGHEL